MKSHSWLLVFLCSSIIFGYTYGLDLIQSLQTPLRQPPFSFTTTQFNLMYFFTFLPICLFNIPIGTIIDRHPVTVSMFVLLLMSLVAQVVGSFMVEFRPEGYLGVIFAVRAVFGMAGEGIFTVQSIVVTKYGRKEDFQFVLSLCLSLPFVLDSVNSLVTTQIYDQTGNMTYCWLASVAVCLFSLLCGVAIYLQYVKPARKSTKNQVDSLLAPRTQSMITQQQQQQEGSGDGDNQDNEEGGFNLRELRSFGVVFWVLILSQFFTQISLGSFYDNLNDMLVKRFNIPYTDAGMLLIIPFACVAIFSIIFSIVMSKYPSTRRLIYALSTIIYLLAQILLYLLPQTTTPTFPYYLIISFFSLSLSFGYSILFTGLQAALPYVVDKRSIGTAYGVLGCVVGLAQSFMPFVNIAVIDSMEELSDSYRRLNLVYIGLAGLSAAIAVYIKCGKFQRIDRKFIDVVQQEEKQGNNLQTTENSSVT